MMDEIFDISNIWQIYKNIYNWDTVKGRSIESFYDIEIMPI